MSDARIGDIDWASLLVLTIIFVLLKFSFGQPEKGIIYPIVVSSPYNSEDGLIWRTLEDNYFTCFPIEE